MCAALPAHVVPRAALAVVVHVALCFLQDAVQIQPSLKAARKGTAMLRHHKTSGSLSRHAPAGEVYELRFIAAPQQRLSVVQQDGGTDEQLKGEVRVDGLQLRL